LATVASIGRAAPPEAQATHALYERYAAQILRYCLHQLGSREEAEDAVQSTFLNAFRGLKRGIEPELESAWLFKIAHNVCLSRRRSTWRRGRLESPADFELVEELAPAPSRRADELIGLQDVLEGMPEQQRRAILLREWQGLSYREIAEELELSQAAIETLIFRARRSLAAGLERPVEAVRRRRSAPAAVLGNLFSAAQGWLFGGGAAAVKVAATVAVVGAGTVAATAPVRDHAPPAKPRPARQAVQAAPARPAAAPVVAPDAYAPAVVTPRPAEHVAPHIAPVRHTAARHAPAPKPAAPAVTPQAPTETPSVPPPALPAPAPRTEPVLPPAAQVHAKAHAEHARGAPPGRLKTHVHGRPAPNVRMPASSEAPPASEAPGSGNGNGGGDGAGNGQGDAHGNGGK
jgi:RNA polymerase sigma factor (sigma-70 family)